MITAHDLLLDQFSSDSGTDKRLTTWYAQGQSDGFGDRLLMFDNTNAPSWEILRFKPTLAREGRFEAMLRERVEQLTAFQHDAFPLVRPIKRLGSDDGLAVVSTYSGGASLSEALKRPRSAEFALRLIRQLVPALAALQRVAPGLAHGAVTLDRIVLSADGRLMIREHMIGLALDSLEWPASRLWSELGLLAPRTVGAVRIDERTDIAQLAVIALSLMAGRRIGPDEYPDRTSELLDELTLKHHLHNPSNPTRFQALRHWLERALQLSGQSFTSAHDAEAALAEFQDAADSRSPQPDEAFRAPAARPLPAADGSASTMWSAARTLPAGLVEPLPPVPSAPPAPVRPSLRDRLAGSREWLIAVGDRLKLVGDRVGEAWSSIPAPVMRWATVVLALVAIVEAVFIGRLLRTPSAASAPTTNAGVVNVASNPTAPAIVRAIEQPVAAAEVPLVLPTATVDPKLPEIRPLPAPAVRTGGVRVTAPIELNVFDGERIIGSTADGPVVTAAGRRELDFVNTAIGYRVRQAVEVKAGQIVSVTVPVPNGTLNINAQPWAAVWIDGNAMGETPIGNLSIVPGEHEVVFRHPQLGERREKVLVRSGVETRVAVNFQR
jgi:hypothetical protein